MTSAAQRAESRETLLALLPVGSTAYTLLRHVSRSGMLRHISVVVSTTEGPRDVTWDVSHVIGARLVDSHGHRALKVSGAGMDMGFHVVYGLSRALYPNGHPCIGQAPIRCPSNDHSNDYGTLARQYAETHGEPSADYAERSDYCSARADWMKSQESLLWSPTRVHSDGGYAVSHGWL